jgi:hypothetical protein
VNRRRTLSMQLTALRAAADAERSALRFMSKLTLSLLLWISLQGFLLLQCSCSSAARMREVESAISAKPAPAECLAAFREFFAYIKKTQPDMIRDQTAQNRWLSRNLRKALAHNVARFANETNVPDFPTNQTFLGVWSRPEIYSIIGSRHYDYHDAKNPEDNRAIIDVLYDWGNSDSLDNQYPGQKSLKSFIFVFEEGAWKLDDIYNFTDAYASPESLSSYWNRDK